MVESRWKNDGIALDQDDRTRTAAGSLGYVGLSMEISVLGPLRVIIAGRLVALPAKQRTLLAILAFQPNQFGFVQPVLARREDRVVVGGHQRLVAARHVLQPRDMRR